MAMLKLLTLASLLCSACCVLNCKAATGTKANLNPIQVLDLPESKLPQKYDSKGLQPFFNLAKSFMNTVQPKSLGEKWKEFDTKDISSSKNIDLIKDYEISIVVAAGFGFLFAICMPFVGICFCCCRCCNNCGGAKNQKPKAANQHRVCCVMSILLFLVTIFMLCGVLFMFVTNNRLHTTIKESGSTYAEAVNEVVKYANSTVQELISIPNEQIPCVTELVTNDLGDHGIRQLIGVKIQNLISTNLTGVLTLAFTASQNLTKINALLEDVKNSSNRLKAYSNDVKSRIEEIRNDTDAAVSQCQKLSPTAQSKCSDIESIRDQLTSSIDYTTFPDINDKLDKIKAILDLNLTGQLNKAQKILDDIPETVVEKSKSTRQSVKSTIVEVETKIKEEVDKITNTINKNVVEKKASMLKYKKDYFDADSNVFKYEDNRWYAYIGLSSVMVVIVLLIGLGLTFGICGYRKDRQPSHRKWISNHGGNCLMASVGFMFIFSWLLMIFCVIWFVVGIHLHIGCRDMKNGELIDQVQDIKYDGTTLSIQELLKNCRKNEPIYLALNGVRFFNITEKFDIQSQTSDFDTTTNDIKIDLSDQEVLTDDAKKALQDIQTSGVNNIDFNAFTSTLAKQLTDVDLNEVVTNLTKISNDIAPFSPSLATKINNIITKVNNLQNNIIQPIESEIVKMKVFVEDLQGFTIHVQVNSKNILDELTASAAYINVGVQAEIKELIKEYVARLISWLTQGSTHIINEVQTNLAKCKPVSTLYDGMLNTFLCDNLVQNANGFWLALGWCLLFFIPAIILCVRLAKYFRKMEYDVGHEEIIEHPPYNDKIPLHSYPHRSNNHEHFASRHRAPPPYSTMPFASTSTHTEDRSTLLQHNNRNTGQEIRSYDNNMPPPPYQPDGYQNH